MKPQIRPFPAPTEAPDVPPPCQRCETLVGELAAAQLEIERLRLAIQREAHHIDQRAGHAAQQRTTVRERR